MKNKSKLSQIKNKQKPLSNLPEGWFLMAKEALDVSRIYEILSANYEVEIWKEAGIAEIVLAEKASMDVETLDVDLGDDFSNEFLKENGVQSLFYLSFPKEAYDRAKAVFTKLTQTIDGLICGDTEDFTPRF